MPFSFTNKSAGDLIRSQDWNAAMAAIAALYDKLNGTTGHGHTGGPEDGPKITTAGLADAAVTLLKLADLAVSTAKLQDSAVTTQKIAANAVDTTKIAANAVGNTQIANLAVTNGKIADLSVTSNKLANSSVGTNQLANASVTAAKLAAGVAPDIGIAISNIGDGQTAAIPTGFLLSECRFHCALKTAVFTNITDGSSAGANATINSSGVVSIGYLGTPFVLYVSVLAIGKKGGW
jgi:hypothetical protein